MTLNRYEQSLFACRNGSHEWTRRSSTAYMKEDEENEEDEEDEGDEEDEEDEGDEEDQEK